MANRKKQRSNEAKRWRQKKKTLKRDRDRRTSEGRKKHNKRSNNERRTPDGKDKHNSRPDTEHRNPDSISKRNRRSDSECRTPDGKDKHNSRPDTEHRRPESTVSRAELKAQQSLDYEPKVEDYEANIKQGPTIECISCDCLFFKTGTVEQSMEWLTEKMGQNFVDSLNNNYNNDTIDVCKTCKNAINNKLVPRLCVVNGLKFPDIPTVLRRLTPLEERLVAPRIPFMSVRELRPTKQFGIKGNVINVPIDLQNTVSILPRAINNTDIIQIKLKRMKKLKHDYIFETVRPRLVYEAAEYLMKQTLYIDITLDTSWLSGETQQPFVCNPNDLDNSDTEEYDSVDEMLDETDPTDEPVNVTPDETFLKQGLIIAPGEGVSPQSIFRDEFVEELSFPKIFGGQPRSVNSLLHYSDIVRSELKRSDRRCCVPSNIFFKLRVKEMIALRNAITTCLRMTKIDRPLSAGDVRNEQFVDSLIRNNDAYKVLSDDRSSPAYWQNRKRDLMAMIRQLGIPTLFLTLSAAETRWTELLVILYKVLHNETITLTDAEKLTFVEKCELIRKDPVTCARYFDHRIRELFKLIRSLNGPFGMYEVVDTYIRVEFQHRGSPHVHCLLWLKDAPLFDPNSDESRKACVVFIDKYITCNSANNELDGLQMYQYHKHSKSCERLRGDKSICRFKIPYYPMSVTQILDPLNADDLEDKEWDEYERIVTRIHEELRCVDSIVHTNQNKDKQIDSFDTYLANIGITIDKYIRAIRTTLKRSTVFLKRQPHSIRTNSYNTEILLRHRANTDLQFILDPYACVHYILNYINKAERGMSQLLRQLVEETNGGNLTHRQRLTGICRHFINCSEVSAQEAVYILLRIPLSVMSRVCVYINTGRPEQRIKLLKSKRELEELDDNSTDITSTGPLDYYAARPDSLESLTLAEFVSHYNYRKRANRRAMDTEMDTDSGDVTAEETNERMLKLKNRLGFVIKRKKPKLIRYRKYNKDKEPQDYYREKLMLYYPWRNETQDLLSVDGFDKYNTNCERIREIEKQFVHNLLLDLDDVNDIINQQIRDDNECKEDKIADDYQCYDLKDDGNTFDREMDKPILHIQSLVLFCAQLYYQITDTMI